MDYIKEDPILKFNPDTLLYLRRQYNYEKPGEMNTAVDVLENWIKKQEHFTKKDYCKYFFYIRGKKPNLYPFNKKIITFS